MFEEILPNLYKIEVPLPRSPLKETNCWIIKGDGKTLMVDTGWNHEKSRAALETGLKELNVDLNKTDFFITHAHADHVGLVAILATKTSKVYFNQTESGVIKQTGGMEGSKKFAYINGFPEEEVKKALANHPGNIYSAKGNVDLHTLKEGDTLSIGDYSFQCIATPGHTQGHMCLYEPNKKILLAGDHILIDITPNISLWADDFDPLADYINSLNKVYTLDVKLVLPGHRSSVNDCKERINELKRHHVNRANEVLAILENGDSNAFKIAGKMTWDMDYPTWEAFPPSQKWFAFGEAVAHLKYLEGKGRVKKETRGRDIFYCLVDSNRLT